MKKLLGLFAALFLAIGLTSCGGGTVLADANHDYYATGQFAGWGDATSKAEFKMEAIAVSDSRVSSIRSKLNGAKYLYVVEVTLLSTPAGWTKTYKINGVDKEFDGNQAIKVIQTDVGSPAPNYWAQNKESGAISILTPDTLYIPPYREENTDGAGTWGDDPFVSTGGGKYLLVFAVFDGSKGMGIIKL
jgi:hypothetical protein